MPIPEEPKKELHSTYFVQDRSNEEEMKRVRVQDHLLTTGMGGPLPEQPDPSAFRRVLDVGCGTGDWLMEVARTYPTTELLIGVDISATMLRYARAQVEDDPALSRRVEFAMMDALRMLEFQDDFFDMVNERLAMSYLRTWEWRQYLSECMRVCHPGGVIRFTECDIAQTSSEALNQWGDLFFRAMWQSGHFFTEDYQGITAELPHLFKRHGLQDIQIREHILHYQAGTEQCDLFIQDATHAYRTLLPFLKKWTQVPNDYDEQRQQALQDMQQPDFEVTWRYVTCWGTVPRRNDDPQFLIVP